MGVVFLDLLIPDLDTELQPSPKCLRFLSPRQHNGDRSATMMMSGICQVSGRDAAKSGWKTHLDAVTNLFLLLHFFLLVSFSECWQQLGCISLSRCWPLWGMGLDGKVEKHSRQPLRYDNLQSMTRLGHPVAR